MQHPSRPEEPATAMAPDQIKTQVIEDLHRVLTSENVTGAQKRDLLALVVDYVLPRKDGAEVRFLPEAFPQTINRITTRSPTSAPSSGRVSSLTPPPSITIVRPDGVSTTMQSPCPTSKTQTRSLSASGSGCR